MNHCVVLAALYGSSSALASTAMVGAWRRRHDTPAAAPLAVVALGLAWWSGVEAFGTALPDGLPGRLSVYLMIPAVGVVVAGFCLESHAFVSEAWRPSRRRCRLLMIHPVAMTGAVLTDPWHHRFATFLPNAGEPWPMWIPGPLFWLHAAYCYLILTWSFAALVVGLRRSTSPLHRRQLRSVILAALIPTVGNVITLTRSDGGFSPDLTPVFLLLTGMVHYYAVFRQGLLRLLPIARGLVVDNVSDAILVVDTRGLVVDINPAGCRLARMLDPDLPTDLVGLPVRDVLPPVGHRPMLVNGEYQVSRPGREIDLDLRVSDLADRNGRPLGRVVVARDVTELNDQRRRLADVNERLVRQLNVIEDLRRELAELAVRDELTGLYNRRHLMAQLEVELDRARSCAAPLAVVLLDIDHFKSVNDRFGHTVGDALLAATAQALAGAVRVEDTVARYGGEEFVVLLPGASLDDAMASGETLRRRCSNVLVESGRGPVSATISVGVASFPDCGWTSYALLQSADEALYVAKGAGRDRVVAAFRV